MQTADFMGIRAGTWRKILAAALAAVLGVLAPACHKTKGKKKRAQALAASTSAPPAGRIRWKGVIMTGDDSITAFDNARKRVKEVWIARGVKAGDIRELSMTRLEQKDGVQAASAAGLKKALASLAVDKSKAGEGCLVHLTSHGSPWGFYLRGQAELTPTALDRMLTAACGDQPTVVMVSACYSGVFTGNVMTRKNRAVLTAARDDRNSFGCGVEDTFTFWDACVIENLPKASNVPALARAVSACIRAKERERKLHFSYPQATVGAAMARVPLFNAKPAEEAE